MKTINPNRYFDGKDGRTYVKWPTALIEYPGLSYGAKFCWVVLAKYAGKNGKCFPSQAQLARDLRTSPRHVRRLLAELVSEGFIRMSKRYHDSGSGGRTTDAYEFFEHDTYRTNMSCKGTDAYRTNVSSKPSQDPVGLSGQDPGGLSGQGCPSINRFKKKKAPPSPSSLHSSSPLSSSLSSSETSALLKADEKPIAGAESPKTAIRASGRNSRSSPPGTENPDPDPDPKAGGASGNLCAYASQTELQQLRGRLTAFMDDEEPREGFELSCLLRARGASVADIIGLLNRRWAKKKFRPGGSHGPRTWNWFLTIIGQEFADTERGRYPEPPAGAHADTTSADELARGIETLEAIDDDTSLVRSYTCECGNEIRQYLTRIVGRCTCGSLSETGAD